MKAIILALVALGCCVLSAHAGSGRRLFQEAPVTAPSAGLAAGDCIGQPTVFDVAEQAGLTTLIDALTLDNLTSTFDDDARYPLQYTVFAPTNEAFEAALATLNVPDLEGVLNAGLLDALLQYHFLIQPYTEAQLESLGTASTNFQNQTLSFGSGGSITGFGSSANITIPDQQACQTIVHVIDNVLIPDTSSITAAASAPTASA